MPAERLSMRKTKEILYLKWAEHRRHRHIARALGVGVGTVSETVRRATVPSTAMTYSEPRVSALRCASAPASGASARS